MANKKHALPRRLYSVGPDAPFRFVEAYKSLRTNLEFLSATTNYKTLLITSSVPEEGKSNVAVNLALTLSATGKKVVLVDGDLRKGTLGHYLHQPKNHAGITSLMAGTATLQEIETPVNQTLHYVPVGPLPPNPVEMLSSEKMQRFFEHLKEQADYVIVDTPPVSVVTDAAVLSRFADGVILVVRPGITTIQGAQLSKKNMEAVNAKLLGVILNAYDVRKSGRKDGYYYSYSYDYDSDD